MGHTVTFSEHWVWATGQRVGSARPTVVGQEPSTPLHAVGVPPQRVGVAGHLDGETTPVVCRQPGTPGGQVVFTCGHRVWRTGHVVAMTGLRVGRESDEQPGCPAGHLVETGGQRV